MSREEGQLDDPFVQRLGFAGDHLTADHVRFARIDGHERAGQQMHSMSLRRAVLSEKLPDKNRKRNCHV